MLNEMNPGSFTFGPLWWAIFIAIAATFTVGVMCLFLWQASKDPVPRSAVHQRIDRSPAQVTGQQVAPQQVAATGTAALAAPLEDETVDLLAQSPVKIPA